MIREHIRPEPKVWGHDRSASVGASEIGGCARQAWWAKHDPLPDTGGWGFQERGNVVERWVVERLVAAGVPVEHAQQTLTCGPLSATVDLLVGNTAVELKSFDPRKRDVLQHRHQMQVQAQIGLWREVGGREIEDGMLVYVNASDLSDIREFPVERDEGVYRALRDRAERIMSADDPSAFPPEGRLAGGKECKYCPYQERCKVT